MMVSCQRSFSLMKQEIIFSLSLIFIYSVADSLRRFGGSCSDSENSGGRFIVEYEMGIGKYIKPLPVIFLVPLIKNSECFVNGR